jgi:hypothetical protein
LLAFGDGLCITSLSVFQAEEILNEQRGKNNAKGFKIAARACTIKTCLTVHGVVMMFVQFSPKNGWMTTFILAMSIANVSCVQPPVESASSQPLPSSASDKTASGSATQRIMARLDGLSGEADPRLSNLRSRFAQLGMTVLSMGVSPNTSQPSAPNASKYSAFIVVVIDPSKADMPTALKQVRALETFAYVEADQLLRNRQ